MPLYSVNYYIEESTHHSRKPQYRIIIAHTLFGITYNFVYKEFKDGGAYMIRYFKSKLNAQNEIQYIKQCKQNKIWKKV